MSYQYLPGNMKWESGDRTNIHMVCIFESLQHGNFETKKPINFEPRNEETNARRTNKQTSKQTNKQTNKQRKKERKSNINKEAA